MATLGSDDHSYSVMSKKSGAEARNPRRAFVGPGGGSFEGSSFEGLSQVPPPAHVSRYELDQNELDKPDRLRDAEVEAKVFMTG